MKTQRNRFASLALVLLFSSPGVALANERHFTYSYESGVLPTGAREFEMFTTARLGREQAYRRFDGRAEFEVGLSGRLQTALYVNFHSTMFEILPGTLATESAFDGISSEWKYKFSDPVADGLGLALYGELSASPDEAELEMKLILDKRVGNTLLVANVVAASEFEFELDETEVELELELDLGVAYFLTPHLSLGLEVVNHNEIYEGTDWEHSSLFAGPVIAYAAPGWWVALSVLPQLPALKNEGAGSRVLDAHEKVNARLIFSFEL